MNLEELFNDKYVKEFSDQYLPKVLTGKITIDHKYDDRFLKKRNKPSKRHFITLENAFNAYYWPNPNDDFDKNNQELKDIQVNLTEAIKSKDEKRVLQAIKDTLFWGAGYRKSKLYTANVTWLDSYLKRKSKSSALQILKNALKAFNQDNFNPDSFSDETMRSNAGYTKIYSLIINNFIIYDSRVAAGLGLLVRKFCQEKGLSQVPNNLSFARSNATGKDNRNPSIGTLKFPHLSNNHSLHAKSNWLANQVLFRTVNNFKGDLPSWLKGRESDAFRRIEAALFMLGKDIPDSIEAVDKDEWIKIYTLSRNKPFYYREDEYGNVELNYGRLRKGRQIRALHTIPFDIFKKIYSKYKKAGDFATGSSQVVSERPKESLGWFYKQETGNSVGVISYLMAYLVHKKIAVSGTKRGTLKLTKEAKQIIEND